jgi:hypothetical protein
MFTEKKVRASRVVAPGAQRIILTGIMAVSDDFNRLRLLLLNEQPDGTTDGSWGRLRHAVSCLSGQTHTTFHHPYEANQHTHSADPAEEICGTVWIVLPTHRRTHWLKVAESLRGRWVTVEATVRPYMVPGHEARGASLDLAMLTPMSSPLTKAHKI